VVHFANLLIGRPTGRRRSTDSGQICRLQKFVTLAIIKLDLPSAISFSHKRACKAHELWGLLETCQLHPDAQGKTFAGLPQTSTTRNRCCGWSLGLSGSGSLWVSILRAWCACSSGCLPTCHPGSALRVSAICLIQTPFRFQALSFCSSELFTLRFRNACGSTGATSLLVRSAAAAKSTAKEITKLLFR
jgi:hypothetical protein